MSRRFSPTTTPVLLVRLRWAFPYVMLLVITAVIYAPSLFFQFVWDDVVYVTQNYRIQGLTWPRISAVWTRTYLGHYAPIHHSFLALVHQFSGLNPFGYHLGQLLVHTACVCMIYLILTKLEAPRIALIAAFLFAIHPANVETVAWVSESKSTLAFLFFLGSFWFFIRYRENDSLFDFSFCLFLFVLSVLSKINTVVAPAIYLALDYRNGFPARGRKLWSLVCLFLASGIFVVVHLASFHGSENALADAYMGGIGTHIANLPFILLFYLRLAVYPNHLSAWEMFNVQIPVSGIVAIAWVCLLVSCLIVLKATRRAQFWCLWFLIFLAPVLQIVPFPIWVADRYLYIPGIGLFVLASQMFCWVFDQLRFRWQQATWAALLFASLAAFVRQSNIYLPIWKNDLILWEATAQTCPTSPYCHANLGLALLQQGYVERGVNELIRSVAIRPIPRYLTALGDAYTLSLGDYQQARRAYDLASAEGGGAMSADSYAKLARLLIRTDSFDEAELAIRKGAQLEPNHPDILLANGFLEWKRGNFDKARQSLRAAMIVTGTQSDIAFFFQKYWGNADDVRRLLADLQTSQAQAPIKMEK